MSESNEKVVVVSGGSKGLGFGITKTLLEEGYCVATFSRKCTPELETLVGQSNGKLYWQAVDIAEEAQLSDFMRRVKEKFGRVGYLVNCAGIANQSLLTLMKSADVSRVLRVTLEGAIALTQACVKQMMVGGFGVIINVSSIVGVRGFKGLAAYSATKAALDGFTRSLAKELGSVGIRVNSIAPGFMDTDMTSELTDRQKARIVRQTPLGRLGAVGDVSSIVNFLLSKESGFITGQTIVIDGGLTV
jgi:3-oxoacyl-[acyl-carrier protein] reductase